MRTISKEGETEFMILISFYATALTQGLTVRFVLYACACSNTFISIAATCIRNYMVDAAQMG